MRKHYYVDYISSGSFFCLNQHVHLPVLQCTFSKSISIYPCSLSALSAFGGGNSLTVKEMRKGGRLGCQSFQSNPSPPPWFCEGIVWGGSQGERRGSLGNVFV